MLKFEAAVWEDKSHICLSYLDITVLEIKGDLEFVDEAGCFSEESDFGLKSFKIVVNLIIRFLPKLNDLLNIDEPIRVRGLLPRQHKPWINVNLLLLIPEFIPFLL